MAVVLTILKIIGIVLLCILGLLILICVAALFVPVRYFAEYYSRETTEIGFVFSWLLGLIKIKKEKDNSQIRIYILGINIKRITDFLNRRHKEETNREVHVEHSKVNMVDDLFHEEEEHEKKAKVDVESDYEEEKESTAKKRSKKSFPFEKISSIITFVRDNENKSGIRKVKKEAVGLFKYLMPTKVKGKVTFGTGDPCTTGWILGGISMFQVAYTDGLTIVPDFEEQVFKASGYVRGRARIVYLVRLFLRGYRDEDIKTLILKFLRK